MTRRLTARALLPGRERFWRVFRSIDQWFPKRILQGLLRFVWNEGHLGKRRVGQVSEFSGNEVGHGDEVFDAAVAARTGSRFLDCAVHGLGAAVVLAGFEAVEDAGEVGGERLSMAVKKCR